QPDLALRVVLPLGISFYTFQSMSYTIDIYRGHARPLASFVDFACFVSMFPQLVAGPIIRFSEIADQLSSRTHTFEKFARGVVFFSLGLAKKVLIANPCGFVADAAFDAASRHPLEAWTGALAYAFQIYFDFSGYSDMAIGLGLMFGFVFPKNFDSPYRAESITDFWRRWHISLSTWLRDYLYLPLGGNRKGARRTYLNLAVVMLLGGLWHGASWNFVVWGGLHGAWLAFERALGKRSPYSFLPRPARVLLTFTGVLVTWVFFRAADLNAAVRYLKDMLALGDPRPESLLLGVVMFTPYALASLAIAGLVTWLAPQTWDWSRRLTVPRVAVSFVLLALALTMMSSQGYNPFIYFIF
ncbi:MAG: MBOAT family protein, partial [Vicinamibacteria bacterium]|nr:MBOAT family protein [Vicinamibacteria bacterium]